MQKCKNRSSESHRKFACEWPSRVDFRPKVKFLQCYRAVSRRIVPYRSISRRIAPYRAVSRIAPKSCRTFALSKQKERGKGGKFI